MRVKSWVGVAAVSLVWLCDGLASADGQRCVRLTLPENVEFFSDLGRVIQRIYDRSPTFRSQCARIAGASNLRVRVHIDTRIPRVCRALTVVKRQGFEIRADVHLPPGTDYSELIGHEFEHLLEQIEGLDLRRLARVRGSGVWSVEREMFESVRAQDAGKVVAAEYYKSHARATD